MKQLIALWILCVTWFAQAAAPIGTNISRYPNTNVAPASSLLLLAVTNEVPATNYNILITDFLRQATNTAVITNWTILAQPASTNLTNWSLIPTGSIANVVSVTYITNAINNISNYINTSGLLSLQTNGVSVTSLMTNLNLLYGTGMVVRTTNVNGDVSVQVSADVTTGFVYQVGTIVSNGVIAQIITASNSVLTAGGAVLWTNSAGIVMLTTNGQVSISSTGLMGGLVVTQDIRFLGHNSASNSVWVCTNATTGEGEWRTATQAGLGSSGITNFLNLSVQAAKLPATNYPGIDAGNQNWEVLYYHTNAENAVANLSAAWQFVVPPDYATNTGKLHVQHTLIATNGPNSSNVVFTVDCVRSHSGDGVNLHTAAFGTQVSGTNTWAQSSTIVNAQSDLVINLNTNLMWQAGDLVVMRLTRNLTNDTYRNTGVGLVGMQLEYTRQ